MNQPIFKLVRDRIPDIIRASGKTCQVRPMSPAEYGAALRAKLVEEAQEVAAAPAADLQMELADLREVMEALMAHQGLTWEQVQAEQQQRRQSRGGFEQRLWLRTISTNKGDLAVPSPPQ